MFWSCSLAALLGVYRITQRQKISPSFLESVEQFVDKQPAKVLSGLLRFVVLYFVASYVLHYFVILNPRVCH